MATLYWAQQTKLFWETWHARVHYSHYPIVKGINRSLLFNTILSIYRFLVFKLRRVVDNYLVNLEARLLT